MVARDIAAENDVLRVRPPPVKAFTPSKGDAALRNQISRLDGFFALESLEEYAAEEMPSLFRFERVPAIVDLAPSRSAVRALAERLIANYAKQ